MKRILSMIVLLALCTMQGCVKDQVMTRTTVYRPVYKTKEEVRAKQQPH
jgi:TRAP-type C4-dicarboxylate transport system permease small subunit